MELTNIREIFRNKDKFADKEVTIGGLRLMTFSRRASARLSSVLNRSSAEGRLKFSALFFAICQHLL